MTQRTVRGSEKKRTGSAHGLGPELVIKGQNNVPSTQSIFPPTSRTTHKSPDTGRDGS